MQPAIFDNNVTSRLTTDCRLTDNVMFRENLQQFLNSVVDPKDGFFFCGTSSFILEFLGVSKNKIGRPSLSTFDSDTELATRIAHVLRSSKEYYIDQLNSGILQSRYEEHVLFRASTDFSNDFWAEGIVAQINSKDFVDRCASTLSYHFTAGFQHWGDVSASAVRDIPHLPGKTLKQRAKIAIDHSLLARAVLARQIGHLFPFARRLSRIGVDLLDGKVVAVDRVKGKKLDLRSIFNFRFCEDYLDVELVDTALFGSPSVDEPVWAFTCDCPIQVKARLYLSIVILRKFFEMLSQQDRKELLLDFQFGKVFILNSVGELIESINPEMLTPEDIPLEFNNSLQNSDSNKFLPPS